MKVTKEVNSGQTQTQKDWAKSQPVFWTVSKKYNFKRIWSEILDLLQGTSMAKSPIFKKKKKSLA